VTCLLLWPRRLWATERASAALGDRRLATSQGSMWLSSESLVGLWIGHNVYPSDTETFQGTHEPWTRIRVQGRHIYFKRQPGCCSDFISILVEETIRNSFFNIKKGKHTDFTHLIMFAAVCVKMFYQAFSGLQRERSEIWYVASTDVTWVSISWGQG